MSTFIMEIRILVITMNQNKTNKAFQDMEMNIILFYRDMKSILNSDRGKRYQYMMLGKTLEVLLYRHTQIKENYWSKQETPKSPLDT
jgi:hypothetical protein